MLSCWIYVNHHQAACSSEEEPWRRNILSLRNYLLFNNHIPKACRSIIQGKTLLWSREEEDTAPEQCPMWTSQNSTGLVADLGGLHILRNHHIDCSWAESLKKGAVWSIYTVGQSLASCYPKRCIQIESECLLCLSMRWTQSLMSKYASSEAQHAIGA